MPNVKPPPEPETGAQVANGVNDAFLGVPGYADDSMLFVMRYTVKVQESLRKVDFDAFMAELHALNKTWETSTEELGGPAARVHTVNEHKQRAISLIKDSPELVAEFDRFMSCSRALLRATKGPRKK